MIEKGSNTVKDALQKFCQRMARHLFALVRKVRDSIGNTGFFQ